MVGSDFYRSVVAEPDTEIADIFADKLGGTGRDKMVHRHKWRPGMCTKQNSSGHDNTEQDRPRRIPKPVVRGSNPPAPAIFRHAKGSRFSPGAFCYNGFDGFA